MKRGEQGFAMLLVFALAAAVAILLYMQLPRVAFESQRNKEELLIARGEQYQRAIQLFVRKEGRYPANLDELEKLNNRRYLRRRYADPMTGKTEWRLIHMQNGVFTDSLVHKNQQKEGDKKNLNTFVSEFSGIGQTNDAQGAVNPALRRRDSEGGAAPGAPGAPTNANLPPGMAYPPQPGQPGVNPNPAASNQAPGVGMPPGIPGMVPGGPAPAGQAPVPGQPYPVQPGQPYAVIPGQPVPGQTGQALVPGQPYPVQPGQPYPVIPGQPAPGQPGQPFPVVAPQGQPFPVQRGGQPYQVGQPYPVQPGQFQPLPPGQREGPVVATTPQPGIPGMAPVQGGYTGTVPQNPANNAAAAMIRDLLTRPRPGGMPGGAPSGMMGMNMNGVAGVASTFEGPAIKLYNERDKYNEWEFLYDLSQDRKRAGGMTPGMSGGVGNTAGGNTQQPSNPPVGFGQIQSGPIPPGQPPIQPPTGFPQPPTFGQQPGFPQPGPGYGPQPPNRSR